jgi:polyisoprenoid-binding protein YceI
MIKTFKITSLLVVVLLFAACGNKKNTTAVETEIATETDSTGTAQAVNLAASTVHWKGEMLKMYSHEGNITLTEGSVNMAGDALVGGSFTVDMTSITPTDKNYDAANGKTAEKLVEHLSSPDFFDVANFPTATFEITSVSGNTATGTLTIRGKSGEETIQNITKNEDGTISGTLTFNRKNYDVAFDHPMKEMVLSKDIILDIKLALN